MNSSELDPKEVLMHLHELGYYNISPEQLQEFIRDLEKLIEHDRTKKNRKVAEPNSREDSTSSTLPNTTDESVLPSPSSPPPVRPSMRNPFHAVRKHSRILEEVSCSSSESSIAPARRVLRECTKHFSEKNQGRDKLFRNKSADASKIPSKSSKTCDCPWRRIGCKCCEELMSKEQDSLKSKSKENLAPSRPKSSFIRTWQLSANARPGSSSQRCDPVALYQQYQQLWKQQKLPGENNHNDLRWSVRERLLGQQPLPRSCSCACKCCPCKLNEEDFSKNPKKVSSKILPRGPFHIEGRLLGPVGPNQDGEFEVANSRLRGVFEVGSDSSEDKNGSDQTVDVNKNEISKNREIATWLSKEDIEKINKADGNKNRVDENYENCSLTEEEMKIRRSKHNRSTCKYCGLIHYILSSSEGVESNDDSQRSRLSTENPTEHPNCHTNNCKINVRKPCDFSCEVLSKKNHHIETTKNVQRNSNSKRLAKTVTDTTYLGEGYWHKQLTRNPYFQEDRNKLNLNKNQADGYWHRQLTGHADVQPSSKDNSSNTMYSSPPRENWPRQFTVQADVHRADNSGNSTISPGSRKTRPTSTPINSPSISPNTRSIQPPSPLPTSPLSSRRDQRPVLNLATATNPAQRNTQSHSDSYFESRIPITLKDFQGEVKTEVEVHKEMKSNNQNVKNPLAIVATKVKIYKI